MQCEWNSRPFTTRERYPLHFRAYKLACLPVQKRVIWEGDSCAAVSDSLSAVGSVHLICVIWTRLHDIHLYLFAQRRLIQSERVVLFSCVRAFCVNAGEDVLCAALSPFSRCVHRRIWIKSAAEASSPINYCRMACHESDWVRGPITEHRLLTTKSRGCPQERKQTISPAKKKWIFARTEKGARRLNRICDWILGLQFWQLFL